MRRAAPALRCVAARTPHDRRGSAEEARHEDEEKTGERDERGNRCEERKDDVGRSTPVIHRPGRIDGPCAAEQEDQGPENSHEGTLPCEQACAVTTGLASTEVLQSTRAISEFLAAPAESVVEGRSFHRLGVYR